MPGPGRNSTRNVSAASLIDTNVLVYSNDPRDRGKMDVATRVLRGLLDAERAILSVQCLTEYFATVTRLPEAITRSDALAQVERLAVSCPVLDLTPTVVLEACGGSTRHRMSIWDALIWAAAKMNGVPYLVTEDGTHGRVIEGVTYVNPFDPSFDLAVLLA